MTGTGKKSTMIYIPIKPATDEAMASMFVSGSNELEDAVGAMFQLSILVPSWDEMMPMVDVEIILGK